MTTNITNFRQNNGLLLLKQGNIIVNKEGSYIVKSQTLANKQYIVELLGTVWVCSCRDFEYRRIECCKHINAVKLWRFRGIKEAQTRSFCRGCYQMR
jgi:hypothetical protein